MKTTIMAGAIAGLAALTGQASAEKALSFGYQNNEESFVHQGILEMKSTLEAVSGGEMTRGGGRGPSLTKSWRQFIARPTILVWLRWRAFAAWC